MATTMATTQMPDNFHEFFMKWTAEQKLHLHELISASKSSISSTASSLVNRVISHYEEYYRVKSDWAQDDALILLSPPWRTELESSFQWIGGWRPSMAFHLLYSKSGLQFKAWLDQGSGTTPDPTPPDDLGELSAYQLNLVNQLHLATVEEERKISEKMAEQQETVADKEMVELSHEVTMSMGDGTGIYYDHDQDQDQIESTLKLKEDALKKILEGADDLRLKTLKGVIQILSPNQALHFLIAAAELHLRLHDWGKQHNDIKPNLHCSKLKH